MVFPRPPDPATHKTFQRIAGHATSAQWLPEGLSRELDELRAEQLERRAGLAADLAAVSALAEGFVKEDRDRQTELRQAARDGGAPPPDGRTRAEERISQRTQIEERIWAGVHVYAELVDRVIDTIRTTEDELPADCTVAMSPPRRTVLRRRPRSPGRRPWSGRRSGWPSGCSRPPTTWAHSASGRHRS